MSFYGYVEHSFGIPVLLQGTLVTIAVLMTAGLWMRRQLRAANGGVLPDDGITVRNILEMVVESLASLSRDIIGAEWRRFMPLVGSIFTFILLANLIGLVPGFEAATSDMNLTYAWAAISFVVYNYVGIRKYGFRYFQQFLGPGLFDVQIFGKKLHVRLLAPLFLFVETATHIARLVTLAVRLAANMFADHTVVAIWLVMVPIAVPAIFMGLGILICMIQAFVFALLTMIYIGMALEEPH